MGKNLFILVSFFSIGALADVNLRYGNYELQQSDWKNQNLPLEFKIVRSYDSREHIAGIFGSGWCANFEKEIRTGKDGAPYLSSCGLPEKNVNGKRPVKTETGYVRTRFDGSIEHYNQNGNLVAIKMKDNEIKFKYGGNGLEQIQDEKNHTLTIKYADSNGRPMVILLNKNPIVKYQYIEDQLSEVITKKIVHYEYTNKKLTEIKWPDGKKSVINYDKKTKKVISFLSRKNCLENYHYQDYKVVGNQTKAEISIQRTCPGAQVENQKYQALMENKSGKLQVLKEIRESEKNKKKVSYTFSEKTGQPETIKINGKNFSKQNFDDMGRLVSKETIGFKVSLKYQGSTRNLASINLDRQTQRQYIPGPATINYLFLASGILQRIETTDGDAFQIVYAKDGRFKKIMTPIGEEISLQFFEDGRKKSLIYSNGTKKTEVSFLYDKNNKFIGMENKFHKNPDKLKAVTTYLKFQDLVLPVKEFI
jgi:hypothetical protein